MARKPKQKVDAVFEGGGVKGIGLVGAIAVTEEHGYTFENIAGTSAGAIVGALVAAGYSAFEMRAIMQTLNYRRFADKGMLDHIPLVGKLLSLGVEKGVYEGRFLEEWLAELLAAKGVETFGDLVMPEYENDPRYRYKLRVIASDCTHGAMLVLPQDIAKFGLDPDDLPVARAVRMSMSIPYFFEPVVLENGDGCDKAYVVDGAILSNFPVYLFDDGTPNPPWPTFGYRLMAPLADEHHPVYGPVTLFVAMFSTMMKAHDARIAASCDFARTISIPTTDVAVTDFDISPERSRKLYLAGRKAARAFFRQWDFETWKQEFRQQPLPVRCGRMV